MPQKSLQSFSLEYRESASRNVPAEEFLVREQEVALNGAEETKTESFKATVERKKFTGIPSNNNSRLPTRHSSSQMTTASVPDEISEVEVEFYVDPTGELLYDASATKDHSCIQSI